MCCHCLRLASQKRFIGKLANKSSSSFFIIFIFYIIALQRWKVISNKPNIHWHLTFVDKWKKNETSLTPDVTHFL
jgi:hypothetical protein